MQQLETYFKGLADVNRLRMVNLLLYGELCGCDIRLVLEIPQPNVSRHLTYLKHAGLVTDRRDGYRVFYRLVEPRRETVKGLLEFLRAAFQRDETLRGDLLRLKRAIKEGACTVEQLRPWPGVAAVRPRSGTRVELESRTTL